MKGRIGAEAKLLSTTTAARSLASRTKKTFTVLGIETSCDETATALLQLSTDNRQLTTDWHHGIRVLSNVVASQIDVHRKTGGVVPEVAAREHVKAIIPIIRAALQSASYQLSAKSYNLRPDVIAVTNGPGLITSLLVGVETARTLAAAWNIPLVAVNHLEGHIMAALLPDRKSTSWFDPLRRSFSEASKLTMTAHCHPEPVEGLSLSKGSLKFQFPVVALLVSGGHTELVLMRKWLDYKVIGETLDDAAGEAFDKVAKILGLPYPGGPAIEAAAKRGSPTRQPFTPPMLDSGDYNFSFSGIKTAVLYRVRDARSRTSVILSLSKDRKSDFLNFQNDIAAGFQKAVVEVLIAKTVRAARAHNAKTIILCGGVAANTALRKTLANAVHDQLSHSLLLLPDSSYCGDNAAMIAAAGALRACAGKFTPWQKVEADPTLGL